ncbi:MAG: c-type cytochrome [Betaproteobacteria bacterium]|nr:c-type cytochrome [Betaproteobacteria bacterium]
MAMAAATLAAGIAVAQQPAPPPPAFAPSNLSAPGVRSLAANCAACHGTNGKPAPGSTLAGLAGKPRDELLMAMTQFKEGKKPATVMHQLSKGYSDAELAALADYFSKQSR